MRLADPRCLLRLLAVLAAGVLVAACAEQANEGGEPSRGEDSALVQESTPLEHIHGLGINPADEELFIATHNGLFAVREGETTPKKVGQSGQDIMGFSVVGADRFIGSGHPAFDQNLPPHLGLIESRDGGQTWKNLSLLGEADFHVLESSDGRIYGFDGTQGRLMVSADGGRNWTERQPPAGVLGLAIDPSDPDRVIASTEHGMFASKDAGAKWRPLRSDLGGLLAWPAHDRLYLVDGQGQVLVSPDGGQNWRTRGSIGGQPAAFIADEGELYAALGEGTVKRSTDGGATWTVRAQP